MSLQYGDWVTLPGDLSLEVDRVSDFGDEVMVFFTGGGFWRASQLTLPERRGTWMREGLNMDKAKDITAKVGANFSTFGGGRGSQYNPLAEMLKDKPLLFAAGVPVEDVVRFVIAEEDRIRRKQRNNKKAAVEGVK